MAACVFHSGCRLSAMTHLATRGSHCAVKPGEQLSPDFFILCFQAARLLIVFKICFWSALSQQFSRLSEGLSRCFSGTLVSGQRWDLPAEDPSRSVVSMTTVSLPSMDCEAAAAARVLPTKTGIQKVAGCLIQQFGSREAVCDSSTNRVTNVETEVTSAVL